MEHTVSPPPRYSDLEIAAADTSRQFIPRRPGITAYLSITDYVYMCISAR